MQGDVVVASRNGVGRDRQSGYAGDLECAPSKGVCCYLRVKLFAPTVYRSVEQSLCTGHGSVRPSLTVPTLITQVGDRFPEGFPRWFFVGYRCVEQCGERKCDKIIY